MTPARDRQLDPRRRASGSALRALVTDVLERLDAYDKAAGTRQRRRRPADQASHAVRVEIIACELALAVLDPPERGRFIVPLGYRLQPRRYREPALNENLPALLEHLGALGLVVVRKGTRPGVEATSCTPTASFADMVLAHGVTLADLGRTADRGDPIVLSRVTKDGRRREKRRIDYTDTPETLRLHAEVETINAHLAAADLAFVSDGLSFVDVGDRSLTRRFTVRGSEGERFDQCGRLFGGFWQNLSKSRRGGLQIGGEAVAELDFSSMFTRIALAQVGEAPPPAADLYAIPRLEGVPRSQVKAAVNALYFTSPRATRWPAQLEQEDAPDLCGLMTLKGFRRALTDHLPVLAPILAEVAGYRLMNLESRIMVEVLLRLASLGVAALPLHDALLCSSRERSLVEATMTAVSQDILGTPLPVHLKTPRREDAEGTPVPTSFEVTSLAA